MADARVKGYWHQDRDIRRLSPAAARALFLALSAAANAENDGEVDADLFDYLGLTPPVVAELIECRQAVPTEIGVTLTPGGKPWQASQSSRAQLEAGRANSRDRQARKRALDQIEREERARERGGVTP